MDHAIAAEPALKYGMRKGADFIPPCAMGFSLSTSRDRIEHSECSPNVPRDQRGRFEIVRSERLLEPKRQLPMQPRPSDAKLKLGSFSLQPCQILIDGKPPVEDWIGPLQFAIWAQKASPWWIGDFLNLGDAHFGEAFSQACEGLISADLLQRYESVARRVPAANRRPDLSWSMHAMVARLPIQEQPEMLELASKNGWTSEQLRVHLQKLHPRGKPGRNRGAIE